MTNEEIVKAKEEIVEEVETVWEKCPDCFPSFLQKDSDVFPVVDARQKKENEDLIQEFFLRIQKKHRQKPADENAQEEWEKSLEQDFREFLDRERIICAAEAMGRELLEEFVQEAKRFIERVREFDRALDREQIWQAMRNYLIYAVIVDLQGETQNAGDQILAYSLLYPYTDNFIDDKENDRECKERYNRMIADKLRGCDVAAHTPLEEKTCLLLDMIMKTENGSEVKRISGILLQLLEAQSKSISLQNRDTFRGISIEEILETSIWKGSTSVVADYFIAAGRRTKEEEGFYRKFGFLLQLIDDLQDIEEDKRSGSRTLMTECNGVLERERRVNRLLWFTRDAIAGFRPVNPRLREFVLKNCIEIILATAGRNARYFSGAYLETLEPYMLFSIDFYRKTGKGRKSSR